MKFVPAAHLALIVMPRDRVDLMPVPDLAGNRQCQTDLLDELRVGNGAAVFAEQPFRDRGLVGGEDLSDSCDHSRGVDLAGTDIATSPSALTGDNGHFTVPLVPFYGGPVLQGDMEPLSDEEARKVFEGLLATSLTGQLLPTCGPLSGVADSELMAVAAAAFAREDTTQAVADAWSAFYEFYPPTE